MTGRQLKRWRLREGLSMETVARLVGVSYHTILRWEQRPKLTPKMVARLKRAKVAHG